MLRLTATCFVVLAFAATHAAAQNVGGVPSAVIKPGEQSFEYRAAYGANDDGVADVFAQRFQYQRSFSGKSRARILAVQEKRGEDALKTTTLAIQLSRQVVDQRSWKSALRADGDLSLISGRPNRVRAVWMNEFPLAEHWRLRGDLFIARQFGDNARDGLLIETREELSWAARKTVTIGAQMFDVWGSTAGFGAFASQRHQAGPFVRWRIGNSVRIETSALFGASRAATDADFRVFLGYDF